MVHGKFIFSIFLAMALVVAVSILRLRVRFELAENRRLLCLTIGRSGPEIDLSTRQGSLRLFGREIGKFKLKEKKPEVKRAEVKEKPPPEKAKRTRSLRDILRVLPQCAKPLGVYLITLLKATAVEELEGEIKAGFAQPDLTGMTFGYYQAALAAVPSVVGRIDYIPDWDGASFSGSARISVALPLYRLIYRTVILLVRLPLRKLVKLAIGEKKGAEDGK